MSIGQLYKLEKKDFDSGAEVLAEAFFDYPMFEYILGDKLNHKNIKSVMKFLLKYAYFYGEVYASSSELEGLILFSDFRDYNFSFFRSLRCGALSLIKLGPDCGRRFNKYDEFCFKIHNKTVNKPHQYIILFGVNPKKQGQGFGKKLMLSVLEAAEKDNKSVYLETHGEKNVSIYKSFGFKVVSEETVPDTNFIQYALLKE